jgi:prevent-host-death family protein
MSEEPDTIAISTFKATCLAVLERVRRTGRPVLVTRRGEPVAEVVPPSPKKSAAPWIGSMAGEARVAGDLVEPVAPSDEWETLKG